MTARNASAKPDGDATHLPAWRQAYTSLSQLTNTPGIKELIISANKDMQQFETECSLPDTTASVLKPTRSKLKNSILDITTASQKEIETCNTALGHIGTMIKLKEAPDPASVSPVAENRPKRLRELSASSLGAQPTSSSKAPSSGTGAAAANVANGGLTLVLPPRSAAVFQAIQARTQKQLPLKPGRKVAFRVPGDDGKALTSTTVIDGSNSAEPEWILATIHGSEKNGKYMVQDVEGENGQEPPIYTASLTEILPLPIANVPPTDASHLSAYPEYKAGTIVLALYPETTSFYRAEVVVYSKEMPATGTRTAPMATRAVPFYKLRFDEDEDRVRIISAEEVIDFPGY